jgi:NAD(P)H-hydrate repair Nnr-like enzyme with NAD(P)H-hydrate dehydratase domain
LSDIIDIGQDVLLTPHEGEFKKSFGDNNKLDKVTRVKNAIDQSKCTILLKGIDTVIGDKDNNIVIQENGCPYLATAGTGDILAGMCGAFMSQGINSSMSAMIATWTLSEAAWKIGYGLIAEEIPKMIPKILSVNIS